MNEKRKVTVYRTPGCYFGEWWPEKHLPKNSGPIDRLESKEVEHDAFWFNGDAKYLHRIEVDGKRWYVQPNHYNEEWFVKMLRPGDVK